MAVLEFWCAVAGLEVESVIGRVRGLLGDAGNAVSVAGLRDEVGTEVGGAGEKTR
jgi:hypothetical protein